MKIFERLESEIRSYCRAFPAVFKSAVGTRLFDENGRSYIDFWSGAGVLNYGHNNPHIKRKLLEYLESDGLAHGLDLMTVAKREFLERFESTILEPRSLRYKVQFPGPTGTNAVEAALKLARKLTGRQTVVCFTNGFHGMTLGALAVTGNRHHRQGAGVPLSYAARMPYDGYFGPERDTLNDLETYLDDRSSGLDRPAAFILETVQAEGGVRPARFEWLRRLAKLAREREILLIVDDIQVGCGRTGSFFSFEAAGIEPDVVCLSKSISGFGLPMSLVLLKPEIDIWKPAEHNGTFRGNNLAFVTAAAALERYWRDDTLEKRVGALAAQARRRLEELAARHHGALDPVRGRGLIQGLPFKEPAQAGQVSRCAFERGLVVETAGARSEVLKLLPALVIDEQELDAGLAIIEESVESVLASLQVAVA